MSSQPQDSQGAAAQPSSPSAPVAGTGQPKPGAEKPGSDPARQSGHPAARDAGAGAPTVRPADPSEIDRSQDA